MYQKLFILLTAATCSLTSTAQFTIEQVAEDISMKRSMSIEMIGDRVIVGGVSDTAYNSLNFEMYSYEYAEEEWGTLHTIENFTGSGFFYVRDFAFVDDNVGFAALSCHQSRFNYPYPDNPPTSASIIKTTDGGITWETKYQHTLKNKYNESIERLAFFDELNGIAVGVFEHNEDTPTGSAWIALTSDAGETWTDLAVPASMHFKGIYDVDVVSETQAYIVLIDRDEDKPNIEQKYRSTKQQIKAQTGKKLQITIN